ncbi:MAG: rhombosortase [Pseudomonadales bacterium]
MNKQTLHLVIPAVLSLLILAGMISVAPWQYQREAVLAGSYWLFLSANVAHLNWPHALLNLTALGCLTVLHWRYYRPFQLLALLFVCGLSTTIGLFALEPDIENYAGLSGVLHGLLAWGALQDIRIRQYTGWLLLLALILKLSMEIVFGPSETTASMISAPVIHTAHSYGALAGCLVFVIQTAINKARD